MSGGNSRSGGKRAGGRGQLLPSQFRDKLDIYQQMERDGVSPDRSVEVYKSFSNYFAGDYGKYIGKEQGEDLEYALSKMPTYKGATYRGMAMSDEQYTSFMANVQKGSSMKMGNISSWSSKKSVAENFSTGKNHKVILVNEKNKRGVGVQHLSHFGEEEAEVMYSAKAKFKVGRVSQRGSETTIYVKET